MLQVFLRRMACYEQVIYILCIRKGKAMQNFIDEPLKHLSCISESKWHAREFKQAKGSRYCRLVDVCWFYRNLVKGTKSIWEKIVHPCNVAVKSCK